MVTSLKSKSLTIQNQADKGVVLLREARFKIREMSAIRRYNQDFEAGDPNEVRLSTELF